RGDVRAERGRVAGGGHLPGREPPAPGRRAVRDASTSPYDGAMKFVLRRSLPSLGGLLALVLAVGLVAVFTLGLPLWFPAVFAIAVVLLQYAVNPLIIQWLVPATVCEHDGERYLTDHPVGGIVARRCREAGVPLVKLGFVDD